MPAKRTTTTKDSSVNMGFEAILHFGDTGKLCKQFGVRCIYVHDKWARRQKPKQWKPTPRRLAIMNLALRGNEADFA
jgi:hypothetical protein